MITPVTLLDALRSKLGDQVQEMVSLAPYTSARVGGLADILVTARSADELADAVGLVWEYGAPCQILGSGSNVLVSDAGVRGVVILNRANQVQFEAGEQPSVWCESGTNFSNLSNRCASRGFSGLEWAATVPGTVGGAIYGNAGAFGGDMSASLVWADVLTPAGIERFSVSQFEYGYRTSLLKRVGGRSVILSALLGLKNSSEAQVLDTISQFRERRKSTQPPGASMGSMFKNPPGDHAGRLIEAAGLKGTRIGNVEISTKHANFFVTSGETSASHVRELIDLTRLIVRKKFGIELELEIELIGEW